MTAPPGLAPHPKPTGGHVSANDVDNASAAIRRAGQQPTPGNIRMVVREKRNRAVAWALTDADWDDLVRELPLGLVRPRKVANRPWAVTSS